MLRKVCRDPHGGRVVCPPVESGRAGCSGDSFKLVWLVALWLYALPPTHPPPALHVLGLTCCPTPAPLHRESTLAQNPLDGRGLLQNCAVPCDVDTPMCLWVPQFVRTAQLQNALGFLQFDVFGESREFCKSDIVVPLTRMQAEGKSP
jgi:hypothetical protein